MKDYNTYLQETGEYGIVEQINYPLISISGLSHVHFNEMVISENGEVGVVFAIMSDTVQVLLVSQESTKVGVQFTRTNEYISLPTGESQCGWIVDPLGQPLFGNGTYVQPTETRFIEGRIRGISERSRIKEPFNTGVILVDMIIPLGKGQKELIIGDQKTGKTAFILNTIKTQANEGAIVVYCAIGHKRNDIKKVYEFCEKQNLLSKVIIVAASSNSAPSLIYFSPFSAMTIAEYFRDKGQDAVVILDDLSTHARFYREISLVAQHFPGRESYPGDIFYNHARLLERAGNYKVGDKEVSITCLPIVETVQGDLSSYIPTNVMGMTDGHIFFDNEAFYKGLRPAINTDLSVTRVGKQTQTNLLREINRELSVFLSQYERMQNYSHFGAELSTKLQKMLLKGDLLYSFFQQDYSEVIPKQVQILIFGYIWSSILESPEQITQLKKYLLENISKDPLKTAAFEIMKSASLYDFSIALMKNKDILLNSAQIHVTTQTNTD